VENKHNNANVLVNTFGDPRIESPTKIVVFMVSTGRAEVAPCVV